MCKNEKASQVRGARSSAFLSSSRTNGSAYVPLTWVIFCLNPTARFGAGSENRELVLQVAESCSRTRLRTPCLEKGNLCPEPGLQAAPLDPVSDLERQGFEPAPLHRVSEHESTRPEREMQCDERYPDERRWEAYEYEAGEDEAQADILHETILRDHRK